MENKSKRPSTTIITRNTNDFSQQTDNVYETVVMLSKRANQLAAEEKKEIHKKIEEFAINALDTMEDIYENREQIEVVRHYERQPKPTLVATHEYLNGDTYYRNPAKESEMDAIDAEIQNESKNK